MQSMRVRIFSPAHNEARKPNNSNASREHAGLPVQRVAKEYDDDPAVIFMTKTTS